MTSMRNVFAEVATQLLDENPRITVVLADLSAPLFAAARERHPQRVINLGIREQLLIGVVAGMALEGMRPIAHSYASFLVERPLEQLKLDLSHQDVGAILVSMGGSYDAAKEGRTHQAPGDVQLIDSLPDWVVHVPGHSDELVTMLRSAARTNDRVYIRLSTKANSRANAVDGARFVPLRHGTSGTVLAVGPLLDNVLEATAGLDVTVLYAATVRPFDAATLVNTLDEPAVVLVEPYLEGTSVRCVAEALSHVMHRTLAVGVRGVELRRYGTRDEHERAHGLDAASLRARIAGFLGARAPDGRSATETLNRKALADRDGATPDVQL